MHFEDDDDFENYTPAYMRPYTPKKKLVPITLGFDGDKLERLKKLVKSEDLRKRLADEKRPGASSYWGPKGYADLLRYAADDFLEKYEAKKAAKAEGAKKATKKKAAKKATKKKAAKKKAAKASPVRTSSPAKKKAAKKKPRAKKATKKKAAKKRGRR